MPDSVTQDARRARLSGLRTSAVVVVVGCGGSQYLHRMMHLRDGMQEGVEFDFRFEFAARVGSSQQIQAF